MGLQMIIFTADTDWASDYILDFFFNEVEKYNSPWIIFATNKYERFQNLKKKVMKLESILTLFPV